MYCLSIIIVSTSDFKIKEFLLHWANEKIQHLMLLLSLNTLLVPEDKKEKKKKVNWVAVVTQNCLHIC